MSCEHCDGPADDLQRFCSPECNTCESTEQDVFSCAEICVKAKTKTPEEWHKKYGGAYKVWHELQDLIASDQDDECKIIQAALDQAKEQGRREGLEKAAHFAEHAFDVECMLGLSNADWRMVRDCTVEALVEGIRGLIKKEG